MERRKYERDFKGKQVGNLWEDIPIPGGKERTGYPTQKPLKLLERIIKASSNPGDMVVRPFLWVCHNLYRGREVKSGLDRD